MLKDNSKKVLNCVIPAILGYTSIHFFNNYKFDFFTTITFIFLIILFYKTNKKYDKKINKYSTISAIIFSVLLSVGKILSKYLWEGPRIVFTLKNIIICFVMIIGLFFIIKRLTQLLLTNFSKIKIFDNKRKLKIRYHLLIWLLIFLCWIPYFIRYYPAMMSPDSYYVIHYANNFILSDLHTFGHTWFFGLFFHIGKMFTSDLNVAVAFGTIAQMIVLSLIFATTIKYLYQKGLNKLFLIVMFIFYALLPLNAAYSVILWRDVLFGGAILLVTVYLMEYLTNDYKLNIIQSISLILGIIIILFFRNNGIYIIILLTPIFALLTKKHKLKTLICGLLIITSYYVIKGPVFEYFNVASTKSVEAYSIPLQQIARTVALDGNISKKDLKDLNKYIDVEKIDESYKQHISDPIKSIAYGEKISDNLPHFLKRWAILLIKNPQIYVESYLYQTLGYWYPDIEYGPTGFLGINEIFAEEKGLGNTKLKPNLFNTIVDYSVSRKLPFAELSWSIGLYFLLFILSNLLMLYNNKKELLLITLPVWGLWLIIMIATPVFAELRYVYGMIISTPIIAMLPFMNEEKSTKKGSKKNESTNDNTSVQRRTKYRKNSK